MMCNALPAPADTCSPDANRVGPGAPARLPEWLAHLIALVIRCALGRMFAARPCCSALPSWWHDRPDLPLGSAQALAASRRGAFGNAITWMCRRLGIGPGHPDWGYLSRSIVAFGGSVAGFRAGLPACGLQWWENHDIVPGMIGMPTPTPAADAMAVLLLRQAAVDAPPPALHLVSGDAAVAPPPVIRRQVYARAGTGPPTGPPAANYAGVRGLQRTYCLTPGAGAWPAPPS